MIFNGHSLHISVWYTESMRPRSPITLYVPDSCINAAHKSTANHTAALDDYTHYGRAICGIDCEAKGQSVCGIEAPFEAGATRGHLKHILAE